MNSRGRGGRRTLSESKPQEETNSFRQLQPEVHSRFSPEGNLTPIHTKNLRVPTGSRLTCHNGRSRKKTQLHQTQGHIFGKIQRFKDPGFTFRKFSQSLGRTPPTPAPTPEPASSSAPKPTSGTHIPFRLVENGFQLTEDQWTDTGGQGGKTVPQKGWWLPADPPGAFRFTFPRKKRWGKKKKKVFSVEPDPL